MAGEQASGTTTLADLGEAGVLRAILPHLPPGPSSLVGPGDDAALLAAPDGRVVVTTDLLVEGQDFRRDWSSGGDVGWKAAVQNIADVAAMGAVPTGLVVALGAPPATPVAWAQDFARGLAQACTAHGTGVVGGDLSSAGVLVVSVTALGDLQGRSPVLRSGARAGDVVALAGRVGRSAAGLDLLRAGRPQAFADLVAAHRRPRPPLDAGPVAARAGATAMLDVSDGLGVDLARIAAASGVHVDVDSSWEDAAAAALAGAAASLAPVGAEDADDLARSWVRGGGEDHALLACFPADVALPPPFERIGAVLPVRRGRPAVTVGGDQPVTGGWDHFG